MNGLVTPDMAVIDRLRSRLVVTWSELAGKAGISTVTLARLRRGEAVSVRTVRKLADACGVKPARIVTDHPVAMATGCKKSA